MLKSFRIVCIFAILVSCGESKYATEIKTLDSLKVEVKKLQDNFHQLDSTRMGEISVAVHKSLKELEAVYNPDSIDIRIASIINYYKSFRKSGAKYNIQRTRLKKEIPYTIKQLESLLTDLNNGSLKEPDAKKYFVAEKQAADALISTFEFIKVESIIAFKNYDSISVQMSKLIDSLKSDSTNMQSIRLKKLKQQTKKGK